MDGISLGQGKYLVEILKRFGMMGCKAMATPMALNLKLSSDASSEMVDAMMYHQMFCSLMFLTYLRHSHLVAQHAVWYLMGTIEHDSNQKTNLHGHVDSDCTRSAKEHFWCCFSMRSGMISWFDSMESCMALSTVEENMLPLAWLFGRQYVSFENYYLIWLI